MIFIHLTKPARYEKTGLSFPFLPDEDDDVSDDVGEFIDSSRLGRYAEFMVCAELTRLGHHALHVDAPGFDIILTVDDRSLRVQVKSTTTIKQPPLPNIGGKGGRPPRTQAYATWNCSRHAYASNGGTKPRGTKQLTSNDTDVVALYHHTFGTTIFMPVQALTGTGRMVLPLSQVQQNHADESLKATLAKLMKAG